MLVTCWSVKGGSGTTVVAATLALSWARLAPHGALLVDLAGDAPVALGVPTPSGPGVCDWVAASGAVTADALEVLALDVAEGMRLLPRGERAGPPDGRWPDLAAHLARHPGVAVVDAGTGHTPQALLDASDENLLVLRPCYMAIQRAAAWPVRPTGIVLVDEPGHSITATDITQVLGCPVRAVVPWDPGVLRAVDAGLLRSHLPRKVTSALRSAA